MKKSLSLLLIIALAASFVFGGWAAEDAPTVPDFKSALEDSQAAGEGSMMYYDNSVLGFDMYVPDTWDINDTGYDEYGGTVEFIPAAGSFGEADSFLSVTYLISNSLEDVKEKLNGIMLSISRTQSGSEEINVVREGDITLDYVDCYYVQFGATTPSGSVRTTDLYLVDGGNDSCYFLYYTRDNAMEYFDGFESIADEMVMSFDIIGSSLNQPVDPVPPEPTAEPEPTIEPEPEPTMPEQTADPIPEPDPEPPIAYDDFFLLAGVSSPEDIASYYGETGDIQEDTEEGALTYNYTNMSVVFMEDYYGDYVVNGVWLGDESAPVEVGGVHVGMPVDEALAELELHGFTQNMDIWEGEAYYYYEYYDEYEEMTFVQLVTDGGAITEVSAIWGTQAPEIRDSFVSGEYY